MKTLLYVVLVSIVALTCLTFPVQQAKAATVNLIDNPSVEQAASSTAPVNWYTEKWGTNTTTFTYKSGTAYDGTRSLYVKISSYRSGDAKWYFKPVAVSPNTKYTFSDYYKASVASEVVVRVITTLNKEKYISIASPAKTTTWQKATGSFTTPSNAKSVTVLHLIKSVGDLETDSFLLTKYDVTAPVISNVAATNITQNNANITWNTDESATSQVQYGPTSSYGYTSAVDTSLVTSHSVNLSGLGAGTTYHFSVKSKDASGNEAVSGDATFATVQPDVTPPVISNVAAGNITLSSAKITWNSDESATSQVDYGLTSSYGSTSPADASLVTSHSVSLSGLSAGTTYHFSVKSKDASGNEAISGDATFATVQPDVTPPVISNVVAGNITQNSAKITWNTDEPATSQVQYGLTSSYGSASPADANLVTSHSVSLSGLSYGTTYHFNIRSKDASGNEAMSGDTTFVTQPDVTPPVISNVVAGNITQNSAKITWNTDELATSQVEYGLTDSYGSTSPADANLVASHSVVLSGLNSETTYHFRAKSKDASGNEAISDDGVFKTPDVTPPVISNVVVTDITQNTARITWTTDESATSQVQYGLTSSYGYTSAADATLVTSHSVSLSRLSYGTTYHFSVKSKDASGNEAISGDATFVTQSDNTPPVISNVAVGSISLSSANITWNTDEQATSQVQYGLTSSYGSTSPADASLVTSHSVSLSGLTAGTTYHFSVKSKDASGNEAVSADATFTTVQPDVTPPVISNAAAANITQNSASITWNTDELATSQVQYGLTTAYGSTSNLDATLVTAHTVSLGSLNANTTYHYRVCSTDSSGNAATSADKTFTTQSAVNYVPNSSLEQKSSSTGNPVSWSSEKWGTNAATFSYLTSGHTGTRSVKVQMTSYSSGDAKWYFSPQSVPSGQMYRFADYYKSDVTTSVVILVITKSGTEEYFGLKNAPASSDWREYSDTFVLPADAASVSMLHIVTSVGYLITDDYSVSPYTPSSFNRALLTLTFDDSWEDNYSTAFPVLNSYGYKITQYLCTQYLTDAYSGSELYKIQAFMQAGFEIGSHSVTHPFLTQVSASQLITELRDSKAYIETTLGVTPASFATPYGDYNDTVISAIKQYYGSHRSVDVGYNYKDNFDIWDIRVQNMESTTTLAQVKEWIETAKAGKYWLVIVYHRVATDPEQYDTTPTNFNAQLALMSSEGIAVETVHDALAEILPQLS